MRRSAIRCSSRCPSSTKIFDWSRNSFGCEILGLNHGLIAPFIRSDMSVDRAKCPSDRLNFSQTVCLWQGRTTKAIIIIRHPALGDLVWRLPSPGWLRTPRVPPYVRHRRRRRKRCLIRSSRHAVERVQARELRWPERRKFRQWRERRTFRLARRGNHVPSHQSRRGVALWSTSTARRTTNRTSPRDNRATRIRERSRLPDPRRCRIVTPAPTPSTTGTGTGTTRTDGVAAPPLPRASPTRHSRRSSSPRGTRARVRSARPRGPPPRDAASFPRPRTSSGRSARRRRERQPRRGAGRRRPFSARGDRDAPDRLR